MPTLLVVHHTPSPATHEMLEPVLDGARDEASIAGAIGWAEACQPVSVAGAINAAGSHEEACA